MAEEHDAAWNNYVLTSTVGNSTIPLEVLIALLQSGFIDQDHLENKNHGAISELIRNQLNHHFEMILKYIMNKVIPFV